MNNYNIKYHYVYTIIEKETNKKYIGVRSSDVEPTNDLGILYYSSSTDEDFINKQKNNPNDYEYIVNSIFETRDQANVEEIRLHKKYNVGKSDMYFNKSMATSTSFSTTGNVTVKDENNNTMLVSVNDPRYLSGELVHLSSNKITVKDKNDNTYSVDKNDPRYLSGELVGVNKGKVVIKNSEGIYKQVNKEDISCDVFNNSTYGKVSVVDINGNKFLVDKNDPRYLSGELVGVNKGKVLVKDKNGNKFMVDKNDPRYLSGELIYHLKGNLVSDEIKKQQSISRTGKITKLTKKLTINGKTYLSIKLASEDLNISPRIVSRRCNSDSSLWKEWNFIT